MMNLTSPKFDQNEMHYLKKCMDSGWVTSGPFVKEFEDLFASRHQLRHAMATTSCTAALHMAAIGSNFKQGDEVIVPAYTWVTSANCVEYVGAKPVFVDIDIDTFNIDPAAIESAITPNTRGLVVVHLFGLSAEMKPIMDIAKKYGLAVIEDAACAIGTTYEGLPVGGFGKFGCFSFHPRKVITTGEGGMVTTNDVELADTIRSLRNHGSTGISTGRKTGPYTMATFNRLGYNLRLSDIQAAVGVAQMEKLDFLLKERMQNASAYKELLADVDELICPKCPEGCGHTYQSYVIRLRRGSKQQRNDIMDALLQKGIQTRPGTHAVHRLGYYVQKYGYREEQFPIACEGEDKTITLPIFPGMERQDIEIVVKALQGAIAKRILR